MRLKVDKIYLFNSYFTPNESRGEPNLYDMMNFGESCNNMNAVPGSSATCSDLDKQKQILNCKYFLTNKF